MPFKTPITIREAVSAIHENRFLLPSIQRELVWGEDRIVRLFDSLVRGYPIGSFLFWSVPSSHRTEFEFYEFMRSYHEQQHTHNPKAHTDGVGDITAVLDGQQRLTALYLGLLGTYASRIKWRRRNDPAAYPTRQLYLNISEPLSEDRQHEYDLLYDFQFLTSQDAKDKNGAHWFKVGKILEFPENSPVEVQRYLTREGLGNSEFAGESLFKLHQIVHKDPVILYFEEPEPDLDKVLEIFVRINSGGVLLSYSDLLLSIATSQWQELDAREIVYTLVDELNSVGNGFRFNKDFVLKACLVLTDVDVAFKVRNFTKSNTRLIELGWDEISVALRTSVELAASFGFDGDRLLSNNALIPIAYYLRRAGIQRSFVSQAAHREERERIRKWLITAQIKGVFGGQSDTILRNIRIVLQDNGGEFPVERIEAELLKTGRSASFTEDEVDQLMALRYCNSETFLVLSMLYPNLDFRNLFHLDHIFPKSRFTASRLTRAGVSQEDQPQYLDRYNYLGNLQLLEGPVNLEKMDRAPEDWMNAVCPSPQARQAYLTTHHFPDVVPSFDNFPEFFDKRESLMFEQLKKILM